MINNNRSSGLKDINGREIFENDTIEFAYQGNSIRGKVKFGLYDDNEQYATFTHLGFYVSFIESQMNTEVKCTLPDCLNLVSDEKDEIGNAVIID